VLKDKVIVITGASRGIGEAIARAAVDAGARVALASRKQADLDQVASSLPPDRAIAVACHTGKSGDVDAMFAKAIERFGRVDGLVNNAATNPYFGPLIDTPDAAIDKTFEVNHAVVNRGVRAVEGYEIRVWAHRHPDDPDRLKAMPIPAEIKAAFE